MRRCLVLDLDFGAIDREHGAARGLGAPPRGVRRAGAVESARAEAPGGVHSWAGAAIDAPAQQHCPLRLRAKHRHHAVRPISINAQLDATPWRGPLCPAFPFYCNAACPAATEELEIPSADAGLMAQIASHAIVAGKNANANGETSDCRWTCTDADRCSPGLWMDADRYASTGPQGAHSPAQRYAAGCVRARIEAEPPN